VSIFDKKPVLVRSIFGHDSLTIWSEPHLSNPTKVGEQSAFPSLITTLFAATGNICDEYLAALMLSGSNRDKFSPLCMDLKNQFGFGEDHYPKMIEQCLSLLSR
jgi:hypothetical protein